MLDPLCDAASDGTQVLQYELSRFRFSCSTLSANDARLIFTLIPQIAESGLGDGEHVRRGITDLLVVVQLH